MYELGDRFGIERRTVSNIVHRHEVPMRRGTAQLEVLKLHKELDGIGIQAAHIAIDVSIGDTGSVVSEKFRSRTERSYATSR